jgi:hypothetical protein
MKTESPSIWSQVSEGNIKALCKTLTKRRSDIIGLLSGTGDGKQYSHAVVAQIMALSEEFVRQIESEAIVLLERLVRLGMLDSLAEKLPMRVETRKLADLKIGPIRHESLSDDVLSAIGTIYSVYGPYSGVTLEEFEVGFMRDADPAREAAVWLNIVWAWETHLRRSPSDRPLSLIQGRRIWGALIALSTGVTDPRRLGVNLRLARRIVESWENRTEGR